MFDEQLGIFTEKNKSLNWKDKTKAILHILKREGRFFLSSFLVIFIEQKCEYGTCSIKDNFTDLITINEAAIAFNFITFVALTIMQIWVYRREKYFIEKLEENPKLPKSNINVVFEKYPELKAGVAQKNRTILIMSTTVLCIYITNMILSAIIIFHYYYEGQSAIIAFIVQSVLCIDILIDLIDYSSDDLVLSLVNVTPVCYNDVDPKYARRTNTYNSNAAFISAMSQPDMH